MPIRRAEYKDMARIFQIYDIARHFMAENGKPDQWGDTYPSEKIISDDLKKKQLYVIEEKTVTAVFALMTEPEPDYSYIEGKWISDGKYATIHRVACDGSGKGIVRMITETFFPVYGNIRCDTHADNLPMQKSLEKNGFIKCGIIYTSYGSPRIAYQKIE